MKYRLYPSSKPVSRCCSTHLPPSLFTRVSVHTAHVLACTYIHRTAALFSHFATAAGPVISLALADQTYLLDASLAFQISLNRLQERNIYMSSSPPALRTSSSFFSCSCCTYLLACPPLQENPVLNFDFAKETPETCLCCCTPISTLEV